MFFIVSKIFWWIGEPVTFAILTGILGIVLGFVRYPRAGRMLTASAVIALAAGLLTPAGAILLRPLEERFPQPPAGLPPPAGIIVLGGGMDTEKTEARGPFALTCDGARMTSALELARRYPSAKLVFTGGVGSIFGSRPEAIGARQFFLSFGIPKQRMMFEANSRNTWENGLFTHDLVKPKPGEKWLLVTSAWHMPRSVGIFRRLGYDVIAYPVAYRTFGDGRDFRLSLMSDRVSSLDLSFHEWIGLLAYWLTGKTDALFPAPGKDAAQSGSVPPA
ncbi:MAG: YdcF family protein [Methylocapsa sp.]|nr:YdcF family protein [Methylocapsa sp.]